MVGAALQPKSEKCSNRDAFVIAHCSLSCNHERDEQAMKSPCLRYAVVSPLHKGQSPEPLKALKCGPLAAAREDLTVRKRRYRQSLACLIY